MMEDDLFEPRLGRMRAGSSRSGRCYLHSILAAAARSAFPKPSSGRHFSGSRIARGGIAGRMLLERHSGFRSRRAIVKTRLVRLGEKALGAARAHLRYIERDGATRDVEGGRLYSSADDRADGKAFLERCRGDRHQFRLIVSAEDGHQYEDLRPLIRRFMARMEEDLGTSLDWVAADHVDTLHPHTHVMLRGRDERGANLVIAPAYIKHGMRERLCGLVSLDLGPRSDLEIEQRLRLDVDAERLTSTDRRLLREAGPSRTVSASGRNLADRAVCSGRLRKLASLGLAEAVGGDRWRLDEVLEPTLRRLGEQGDIIRTMQRALTAAGLERASAERVIHPPGEGDPVCGRIVARGLADELGDRHYLIVDGIDGRSHYVEIGKGEGAGPLADGVIVRIAPAPVSVGDTDRRIAEIAAANGGRYSAGLHLAADPNASGSFAQSHVRLLEAIRRRIGGVERTTDGSWAIPPDFLECARRHQASRARDNPVEIELLSPVPLAQLPANDGATWLDRELAFPSEHPRDWGFGGEVRDALARRRAWLIGEGLATFDEGRLTCRPGMIGELERRELRRAADALSRESGLEFVATTKGMRIEGIVRRRIDLPSGRFAMITNEREFMLVPWRPVLERSIGRSASGRMGGNGGISWTLGRARGLEV